jgi:hypothetical protein
MNFKGQVSIFVILGVVVIVGVLLFMNLRGGSDEATDPVVEPIYNFVEVCLEELTGTSILEVSKKGGYFYYPENVMDNGIPYYLYEGKNYQPSRDKIGDQIGLFIEDQLYYCLNDFGSFPTYEVVQGNPESSIIINEDSVISRLKLPLTITKDEKVYQVENFEVNVDARLGIILDSVDFFMEDQMRHQESLCLFCGHDISTTYDLEFTTVNIGEGILIGIKDKKILVNNQEVLFAFANKLEPLL